MWKLYPAQYFQWHHYFGFPDPVLDVLLAKARESRVILDVGANIGMYSLLMADVCRSEVHAFEAATGTAAHLRLHCEMNKTSNVIVNQLAVSDRMGVAELFDHGRGDSGKASLRMGQSLTAERVRMCTIDAYMAANQLPGVDLIKVDVEGIDAAVIRGAWETITRHRPVVCLELTPAWMADADVETIRLLVGLGYRLRMIGPDGRTTDATLKRLLEAGSQHNVLLEPRSA